MKNKLVLLIVGLFLFGLLSPSQYYAQSPSSSSKIVFTAALNAANETSADTSKAVATAWAVLSGDRKHLVYRVTYTNLTSNYTASHFHLGAKGVNGPVIQAITYNGNTAAGSWDNLPDSIAAYLLKGNVYINIHSTNYPGGEIRGQLLPANGIPFTFSIDASQVTSADTSTAAGTGWGILTNINSNPTLTYGVTVAGLTSAYSASHFHIGAAGQNGTVVQAAPLTNNSAFGSWSGIADANLLALIKNGLYFNVHTSNYPAGEVRGQVIEAGPISFSASIDGSQEVPSVSTNASGTGWFVLNDDLSSLGYRITYSSLSAAFTASHFHKATVGISGSVVHAITYNGNTAAGVWTNIPDSLLTALIKENLYVNVHSTAHTGGEIRGQVLINKGVAFSTSLDGSQDVPLILTTGSGTAWVSLINDSLWYRVTIAGLSSTFSASHFHKAVLGVNGSVVDPITFSDSLASSVWADLSNDNLTALINNGLYINVHTLTHPAGEIRGQVLSSDYTDLETITDVKNDNAVKEIPGNYSLDQNYPNPFNPSTIIKYSLPVGGIVSLKVYDLLGREIATLVNEFQNAGNYKIQFNLQQSNGRGQLSSGIYFYRLSSGNFSFTRKMLLLK